MPAAATSTLDGLLGGVMVLCGFGFAYMRLSGQPGRDVIDPRQVSAAAAGCVLLGVGRIVDSGALIVVGFVALLLSVYFLVTSGRRRERPR